LIRTVIAAPAMNPVIRPEQPDDTTAIGDVLRSAFPTEQEAQLVERLRRNHRLLISLVAEVDGMIAGHIALGAIKIEGPLIRQEWVWRLYRYALSCNDAG
jgi:predicted N-acetyltransferase YhbS